MSFKFNSAILLVSSLITGGGAWVGYQFYKPTTVDGLMDWKGLKLASKDNNNLWKALYFQGKNELGEKYQSFEDLKKACIKLEKEKINYEKKNVEFVEQFCLDSLKTRKARIIATGFDEKNFLSEEVDFKVAFILNRYSDSFLSLLGSDFSKESEISNSDSSILTTYKKYCKEALEADDEKIKVVEQVCSKKPYRKASEKLVKDGYQLKSEGELKEMWNEWKGSKHDKYLEGNSLLEDIKPKDGEEDSWVKLQTNKELFGKQLISWCKEKQEKDLFEENFYKDVYPKFKTRCGKIKSQE